MTPERTRRAAAALLNARRNRQWLDALPEDCRPDDMEDAYAIQRLVVSDLGRVVAWKVGAGSAQATPACAPITEATLFADGARLPSNMFHLVGAEAELAYKLARGLPPRAESYSIEEVRAAIASAHAVVEISDTRFATWASQNRPSHVADQLNHGALIIGAGSARAADVDPMRQRAVININGQARAETVGGNPAGDPLRLLVWLANYGARAMGGLTAGSFITTGSLTGLIFVSPPVELRADLPGLGTAFVSIT